MKKDHVKVIFDRKNQLKKAKVGKIELRIALAGNTYKYLPFGKCSASEWKNVQKSPELLEQVAKCTRVIIAMEEFNEELTIANFDRHLGITPRTTRPKETKEEKALRLEVERQQKLHSRTSFLDFFEEQYKKEDYAEGTKKQKKVVLGLLTDFNKIRKFEHLTPENIMRFDDWLDDGTRVRNTICKYHKTLHMFATRAFKLGYIDSDPYNRCDIKHGKAKTRKPLSEEELLKLNTLHLEGNIAIVRDLFIFSAYTGLAYCDCKLFKYSKMTDTYKNQVYIDGQRLKTGSEFYTPILPKAMEVLKKYNYKLPMFSNQFCNEQLKFIKEKANINKPLTFHIARHSFATLCLNHDIPLEEVAKMMGHKNIKTTAIYAKVQRETVSRHTTNLVAQLL